MDQFVRDQNLHSKKLLRGEIYYLHKGEVALCIHKQKYDR